MPNRVRVLTVPDRDRAELERRARSKGAPARVVERARIVLLAADGLTGAQIAERAGCTEPTVIKWRRRYAEAGLAGLEDASRPGGPKAVLTDEAVCEILAATVTPPPESLQAQGVTHWSSRRLADWLRRTGKITVSHDSISRLWRKFCLQPHRTEGFKFSTDPMLEAKVGDVVGLYLEPPENAVVVCVDEKSQIQALDRARPVLPMRPGIPGRQTHDYIRHGTTTLFAALEIATGTVTDACYPRHRRGEFLKFLKKVAAAYPGQELHIVGDNYATHKQRRRPQVAAPPREPADHPALRAHQLLVAQPRGVLLLRHHPPGHPPRHLHLRQGAHRRHRRFHRFLERPPAAVRLGQGRRRGPRQDRTRQD